MDLLVLNPDLEVIGIIDVFTSLIWTDRYCGFGDFSLESAPNNNFLTSIANGRYLQSLESEHLMRIESINIKSSPSMGKKVIVGGRSIETILEQRIIWNQTILNGNFQDGIHQLLDENAMNPEDPDRAISLLEFEESTDPIITELTINSQFFGETLYTAITELCLARNIGYKITLTDQNKFRFKLYSGIDRSRDQFTHPYVIFSPKLENLINSDYLMTSRFNKTVTLVAGEMGIGNARLALVVTQLYGAGTDLDRREMFTDAQNTTRNTPDGTLTDEEYIEQLYSKGEEDLASNISIETFEGMADSTRLYKYGEDFYMGDIVQVENEYGQEGRSRITELIRSQDASGPKIYPTFTKI
jgi:hypothetical protein